MGLDAMAAACCVLPVLVSLLSIRFVYVLWRSGQPLSGSPTAGLRCLIVLGSGEHVLPDGCEWPVFKTELSCYISNNTKSAYHELHEMATLNY
jgi:hypothetical protein